MRRIYFRGGRYPTAWRTFRAFGPRNTRFDHQLLPPRIQERRILYVALSSITCLAEVFQPKRIINVTLQEPWLVGFATTRDLRLLDLGGTWPTRAGASMAINLGQHARARRWSRAIYEAYPDTDGLWYPGSMHANQPAIALYERAESAIPATPLFNHALTDPVLRDTLQAAARQLGYDFPAPPA